MSGRKQWVMEDCTEGLDLPWGFSALQQCIPIRQLLRFHDHDHMVLLHRRLQGESQCTPECSPTRRTVSTTGSTLMSTGKK